MGTTDDSALATRHDLDLLAERLEVNLAIYVDERLAGTERALRRDLGEHARSTVRTLVAAIVLAAAVSIAYGRRRHSA
jgi:hypothetical protein